MTTAVDSVALKFSPQEVPFIGAHVGHDYFSFALPQMLMKSASVDELIGLFQTTLAMKLIV
jgi:hypothetical protein